MANVSVSTGIPDMDKTREQLLAELRELKARNAILEGRNARPERDRDNDEDVTRRLLEQKLFGVMLHAGGRIIFINEIGAKILGTTDPGAIEGKPIMDIIHPDYRDVVAKRIEDMYNGDVAVPILEEKMIRVDGGITDVNVWAMQIIHEGEPAILAVMMDITERKRAEDKLRKLTRVVEESPAIVVITDVDGNIEYVNPQFTRVTGYTLEEARGKNPRILKSGYTTQEEYKVLWDTILSGKEWRGQFYNKKKNGDFYWESAIISPLMDAGGRIAGFMCLKEDITERKRAEDELKASKEQAELYLDLIGHDINNMNQSAKGFLELALETLEADGRIGLDGRIFIEKPLKAIENSSKLIENVGKLQRLMTGGVKTMPIDLYNVFEELKAYDFHREDKGVAVRFGPIPKGRVEGSELLKDVFINLIDNAIKHSRPGRPVTVDVSVERVEAKGRACYKCIIEDDGPGIPDGLKPKMFHRFQRGRTKAKGKGLGLYIVRTLVEGYHGKVWVENRVQGDHTKGSRFVVLLPAT